MIEDRGRSAPNLFLAGLVGLLMLSGLAPISRAQGDSEAVDLEKLSADRTAKARKYPLGRRVSRYLSAAAELVDEHKPDEAEELLLRLANSRLNPYERAYVFRMLGVVVYTAEKHAKGIEYFEQVLQQEALPLRDEEKIRFTIAQLYAQLETWPEVITWLQEWRRYLARPDPGGIYLMALAYYQVGEFDAAIETTREAIALADEPRENWIRMLYGLYTEKQDFESATRVLEELLLRFPKKQYWVQLALIYGAREDYDVSLAVQQMAYDQGFLTEDKELRRLARSYLYRDLPYVRPVAAAPAEGSRARRRRQPLRPPRPGADAARGVERGRPDAPQGPRQGRPQESGQRRAAARHRVVQRLESGAGAALLHAGPPVRGHPGRGGPLDRPPRAREWIPVRLKGGRGSPRAYQSPRRERDGFTLDRASERIR
jgi:tetratricopeptide (TPR) repeat protein